VEKREGESRAIKQRGAEEEEGTKRIELKRGRLEIADGQRVAIMDGWESQSWMQVGLVLRGTAAAEF
jgi:hypothetical protein